MISLSPEQEAYDLVFKTLLDMGVEVYTHSPPVGVPMPFVRLGHTQIVPRSTKHKLFGNCHLIYEIWGGADDRGQIADFAIRSITEISKQRLTDNFIFSLRRDRTSYELLPDQTTEDDLWRARVSITWAVEAR